MTAIAYRNGVMAADTQSEINADIKVKDFEKVKKVAGHLLGVSGDDVPSWDVLVAWFRLEQPRPSLRKFDFDLLVARPDGSIYLLDERGHVDELVGETFYAIGSGGPICMGALEAGASARKAIEIAIKRAPGVGGRVISRRLRR